MKKISLNIIVITLLFAACSKKTDPVPAIEKEKSVKLLSYVSQNGGTYEYKYNGNQMIEEKYSGNNSNSPRVLTFSYHSSGKLKEIFIDYLGKFSNTRTEYFFDNEKLIRTINYIAATNEISSYSLVEYSSGKITQKYFSKADVLTQKNEYFLTADEKNYTKMNYYNGTTLLYTANILKMDDKKNPFKLFPNGFSTFHNTNNALEVDFVFSNPASNQSPRNTLKYNEYGYPTTETDKNGKLVSAFEYIIE